MTVPSPTTVRQAAVLVALEGAAGLVAAVVYVVSGFGGANEPGLNKFGTAAWFAIIHFRPVEYPGLFAFALVTGACMMLTDRLGMSWATHIAFNVTGLLLAAR